MSNEELATAIKEGKTELIIELWQQCYNYIAKYANKWHNAFISRADVVADDLIQSGYIALINAIEYYNPELQMSFIGVLQMHLKTAFAECLSIKTKRQRQDPINNCLSLDKPLGDGFDGETLADTIAVEDEALTAIEENSYKSELYKLLHEAVDELPEKKSNVINAYYFQGKQYKAIAEEMNVSVSYIGSLIQEGQSAIRRTEKGKELKQLYAPNRNYYRHTGLSDFMHSGMSSPEWELMYKERLRGFKHGH